MKPYICIHGHFYQPPRENPWLDALEKEDSAEPYPDWNVRIAAECYSQNANSRILNPEKKIIKMLNNYSFMSFNIGPTLFRWMEKNDNETYLAILEGDKISRERFSGHGSAIAQVYNHIIMPLASRKDKETQVKWGIEDFVHRFKRYPEGMWLPETAVDIESLEVLAEFGILFTILAPHQAARFRKTGDHDWTDLKSHQIDNGRPYICRLPSGKSISLFFYNGGLSHGIGFGSLLNDGKTFSDRLVQSGQSSGPVPRLVNVAVDGETFGHHHRFGDMAMAFSFDYIINSDLAVLTVYGEFLQKFPPEYEVEINENTSWSCAHGVERWRSDCGCNSGKQLNWRQNWRGPLRNSLDWLRDELEVRFEKKAAEIVHDPWKAREEYIRVVLDRNEDSVNKFLKHVMKETVQDELCTKYPGVDSRSYVIKLFELQRFLMLMYTSCGWFFDDIAGLESKLVIRFALRAIQIAEEIFGVDLGPEFLARLEKAPSNMPEYKHGRDLVEKNLGRERIDPLRTTVYFIISLLFEDSFENIEKFHYAIIDYNTSRFSYAETDALVGELKICDRFTYEIIEVTFFVKSDRYYDIAAHVGFGIDKEKTGQITTRTAEYVNSGRFDDLNVYLDSVFGKDRYSLQDLFHDKKNEIAFKILKEAMGELELTQDKIFTTNYRTISYFNRNALAIPKSVREVIENIFSDRMIRLFQEDEINTQRLSKYLKRAGRFKVKLNLEELELAASTKIHELLLKVYQTERLELMEKILETLVILYNSSVDLNIYKAQNLYYKIWSEKYPLKKYAMKNDPAARHWVDLFEKIGENLRMSVI